MNRRRQLIRVAAPLPSCRGALSPATFAQEFAIARLVIDYSSTSGFTKAETRSIAMANLRRRSVGMQESGPFLFVSHVRENRQAALEIVEELERRGVRCWIAPRDVEPGSRFDDEIANALDTCSAMLLIFSEQCNDSEYIRREVTVAGENHKIIIPFRIEDAQPRRGLRVRLADLHWIDGFVSRERAVDELVTMFTREPRAANRRGRRSPTETSRDAEGDSSATSSIGSIDVLLADSGYLRFLRHLPQSPEPRLLIDDADAGPIQIGTVTGFAAPPGPHSLRVVTKRGRAASESKPLRIVVNAGDTVRVIGTYSIMQARFEIAALGF